MNATCSQCVRKGSVTLGVIKTKSEPDLFSKLFLLISLRTVPPTMDVLSLFTQYIHHDVGKGMRNFILSGKNLPFLTPTVSEQHTKPQADVISLNLPVLCDINCS